MGLHKCTELKDAGKHSEAAVLPLTASIQGYWLAEAEAGHSFMQHTIQQTGILCSGNLVTRDKAPAARQSSF